jgi:hypothetical protein
MVYAAASIVLGVVYWLVLAAVIAAAVVFSVLAAKGPRWMIITAAALLLAAVLLASTGHVAAPKPIGAVVALGAVALSAFGGSPAVRAVLSLATRPQVEGEAGGILIASAEAEKPREVLRGGLTIGVLERIATTAALLAGVPEAIAVVIAIKGVGRFSELGASEAQERFIIGTFVSLGWAAVCGALAHLVW